MRPLITLVVLCTVFFVTVNAVPVLPPGYKLETLRDRDAQAGSELEQAYIVCQCRKQSPFSCEHKSGSE